MLTYGITDQDSAHVLILGGITKYRSVMEADLAGFGNILLVFKDDDLVFVCNIEERWGSWCARQRYVDDKWNYKSIEHPHFSIIIERWVRFCLHKGASEGRTGLPSRMQQQAASGGRPGPAMGSQALGSSKLPLRCTVHNYP